MKDKCGFDKAWVGLCKTEVSAKGLRCEEHTLNCASCGQPATHSCDSTGSFVCGDPLCDDCEHTIFEDGSNGGIGFNQQPVPEGMGRHCKKTEQRYKPWYVKALEEQN